MAIYSITVDQHEIPVVSLDNGILTLIDPLVLLLPGHIHLNSDSEGDSTIQTVRDVQTKLSKQTIEKYSTLREETLSNELD